MAGLNLRSSTDNVGGTTIWHKFSHTYSRIISVQYVTNLFTRCWRRRFSKVCINFAVILPRM